MSQETIQAILQAYKSGNLGDIESLKELLSKMNPNAAAAGGDGKGGSFVGPPVKQGSSPPSLAGTGPPGPPTKEGGNGRSIGPGPAGPPTSDGGSGPAGPPTLDGRSVGPGPVGPPTFEGGGGKGGSLVGPPAKQGSGRGGTTFPPGPTLEGGGGFGGSYQHPGTSTSGFEGLLSEILKNWGSGGGSGGGGSTRFSGGPEPPIATDSGDKSFY